MFQVSTQYLLERRILRKLDVTRTDWRFIVLYTPARSSDGLCCLIHTVGGGVAGVVHNTEEGSVLQGGGGRCGGVGEGGRGSSGVGEGGSGSGTSNGDGWDTQLLRTHPQTRQ